MPHVQALIGKDAVELDHQWREVMSRAIEAPQFTEVLATVESQRQIA